MEMIAEVSFEQEQRRKAQERRQRLGFVSQPATVRIPPRPAQPRSDVAVAAYRHPGRPERAYPITREIKSFNQSLEKGQRDIIDVGYRPDFGSLDSEGRMDVRSIISGVEVKYGLPSGSIVSRSRARSIAAARHEAIYLTHTMHPSWSLTMIARRFGNRDHTTILASLRKYREKHGIPEAA